mmetsp:Transcript_15169/g.46916  ORF Transcript_15169/g.46916 Transcript_15169/m.46916 type:complete len:212 (-) Transcript_15169:125-760(-)
MPLMPLSKSFTSQFSPSTWYARIVAVMFLGWCVTRVVRWFDCAAFMSRASSAASVMRVRPFFFEPFLPMADSAFSSMKCEKTSDWAMRYAMRVSRCAAGSPPVPTDPNSRSFARRSFWSRRASSTAVSTLAGARGATGTGGGAAASSTYSPSSPPSSAASSSSSRSTPSSSTSLSASAAAAGSAGGATGAGAVGSASMGVGAAGASMAPRC